MRAQSASGLDAIPDLELLSAETNLSKDMLATACGP